MKVFLRGGTINTPSLLCVEDFLDGLKWAKAQGGLRALRARVEKNFAVLDAFVCKTPWLEYLAKDPRTRSNTSVCLDIVDPVITALSVEKRASFIKAVVNRLDEEGVAYDIGSYRDAPPGLRVWTGITIEASDIEILTEWLEWAFQVEKALL